MGIQDIISIIMDTIHITMDTMDIIMENDQLSQDIFIVVMAIMDITMDIMVMDTFMERDQQNLVTMDIMAITMDFMVFTMDTMDTTMAKQQDLSSEWRIYLTLDCPTFQIQPSI